MTRPRVLLAALCGIVLVAAGAGVGYFLRPAPPPASLEASAPATTAPVTPQEFTDVRKIQVRVVTGPDTAVTTNRSGVLTSTACAPGSSIASGAAVGRIDDVPVLALHLDVPPFRDLAMKAEGSDVAALQTELTRLGFGALEPDGYFGWDTAVAVAALRDQAGMSEGRSLALGEIAWLPQESLAVTDCSAALGSSLSAGSPLAVAEGSLQQLVIDSAPSDLVAGDRTVTVFGLKGPYDGENAITAPEFLSELARTEQAQALMAQDPATTAPATLELSSPVDALQVPASAVFGIGGGVGCIQSGDTTFPVTVLGSTLGASLVALNAPDRTAPDEVNIGEAITHDDCGS